MLTRHPRYPRYPRHPRIPLACLAATTLVALCSFGCSGTQDPAIRVTGVRLTDQSAQGARVEVTLELTNPNDFPLPITKADYLVNLEGVGSFEFDDTALRTMPTQGKQTITLPAAIATKGKSGGAAGAAYDASGSITYEPPGWFRKLLTDIYWPLPSVDFEAKGKLQ